MNGMTLLRAIGKIDMELVDEASLRFSESKMRRHAKLKPVLSVLAGGTAAAAFLVFVLNHSLQAPVKPVLLPGTEGYSDSEPDNHISEISSQILETTSELESDSESDIQMKTETDPALPDVSPSILNAEQNDFIPENNLPVLPEPSQIISPQPSFQQQPSQQPLLQEYQIQPSAETGPINNNAELGEEFPDMAVKAAEPLPVEEDQDQVVLPADSLSDEPVAPNSDVHPQ